MPYMIGVILGDVLGRIGFFRAAGAAILLSATAFVAYRLVAANLGQDLARVGGSAAPLLLFGWAVWQPASSHFRLWIVNGVLLAACLGMWWALIASVIGLIAGSLSLGVWMTRDVVWLPIAGAF